MVIICGHFRFKDEIGQFVLRFVAEGVEVVLDDLRTGFAVLLRSYISESKKPGIGVEVPNHDHENRFVRIRAASLSCGPLIHNGKHNDDECLATAQEFLGDILSDVGISPMDISPLTLYHA